MVCPTCATLTRLTRCGNAKKMAGGTHDGTKHRVHGVRQDVFPLVQLVGGDEQQAQRGEKGR